MDADASSKAGLSAISTTLSEPLVKAVTWGVFQGLETALANFKAAKQAGDEEERLKKMNGTAIQGMKHVENLGQENVE